MLRHLKDAYADVLVEHHRLIRHSLRQHEGREIDTQGDAFFATFESATACVSAVIEMQRSVASHAWPSNEPVRVRMGIHTGEAMRTTAGLVGYDVHRAARIAAVANGGQVLLSAPTAALVDASMPQDANLLDLGLHRLKDLGRPEHIFQLVADGLETSFPPIRSLDNPKMLHNLPELVSSFVGRDEEIAEISRLITRSRLVTLTGAGGAGKTRLALQVAADQLDGSGDGVWFVDLSPLRDADLVAMTSAKVLAIPTGGRDDAIESLVEGIGPRRLLIVLDNCEHLVKACAELAEALLQRCPNVVVLATSREPLAIDGEYVHRVPSLGVPDVNDTLDEIIAAGAVRLFSERAAQHGVPLAWDESTGRTVGQICRLLDGIPLAIELAASRLSSMSLFDLESHLDERFSLLTGGSRTALPRHRTLLALTDWSWELLNGPERHMLPRLSVFAGGFDLAAVRGVAASVDVAGSDAVDVVASLVDKNLVQFDSGTNRAARYRLPETIRQYAARQLEAESPAATSEARVRHRDYFLDLALRAAPELVSSDQVAWLELVDLDLDNFRTAITWCRERGDAVHGLRLVNALSEFLKFRGYASEGAEAIRVMVERLDADEHAELRAESLLTAATLLEQMSSYESSEPLCEDALATARLLGDNVLAARILNIQSYLQMRQGRYERALAMVDEAIELARPSSDARLAAKLLGMRSSALECCGDREGSVRDGAHSLALYRSTGDLYSIGTSVGNLGYAELSIGDLESAQEHLIESLDIARRLKDHYGVVYGTFNLGLAEYLGGSTASAETLFTESLDLARRMGMKASLAYALIGVAIVSKQEDTIRAARLHGAAYQMLLELGEAMEPLEADLRDRDYERLSSSLGTARLQKEFAIGQRLDADAILEMALCSAGSP